MRRPPPKPPRCGLPLPACEHGTAYPERCRRCERSIYVPVVVAAAVALAWAAATLLLWGRP